MSSEDQFDSKKFSDDLQQSIHERIHEDINDRMRSRQARRAARMRSGGGILPGLILMAIGTLILLDHMGVIQVDHLWRFWPAVLIVVGAVRCAECGANRVFSVMLVLVGTLLLLGNLGLLHLTWGELWPIILIAVGVMMIWGRLVIPQWQVNETGNPAETGSSNRLTANVMFGGLQRRITTSNFNGGNIQAIFGGVELDFRAADIEGEEVVLYVEAVFGGIEIVVPERWTAIYEGHNLFGGYSDETRPPLPDVPGAPPRKRLILRGQALFGGISVKN